MAEQNNNVRAVKKRRRSNLYKPDSKQPYRLSRSRFENFLKCPRCFYLDRRLGIEPPGFPPFTLNIAVDGLLKREFDAYRKKREPHPLMKANNIDAIPYAHPLLDEWRNNFKGVRYHHPKTNFIVFGAIDDLWMNPDGELIVVDYKATSLNGAVTLDTPSRASYKRQMEIYQWLLRHQKLKVSDTGYFVYCNADKSRESFDAKLEFDISIIPYRGNDQWIEEVLLLAYKCLNDNELQDYQEDCEYCQYLKNSHQIGGSKHGSNQQIELF